MMRGYFKNLGACIACAIVSGLGLFPGTKLGTALAAIALAAAVVFFVRCLASFADT